MGHKKSPRVNDMNYEYYINKGIVYETEKNNKKIPLDILGQSIEFLVEIQKVPNILLPIYHRKLEWLKKEHPEWLI